MPPISAEMLGMESIKERVLFTPEQKEEMKNKINTFLIETENNEPLSNEFDTKLSDDEKKHYGYQLEESAQIFKELVEKMEPDIASNEYRMIIGDDVSGRIPTYFFDRFLKKISRVLDRPEPNTIFIAGSRHLGRTEHDDKLKSIKKFIDHKDEIIPKFYEGKALIVTDTVQGGTSLEPLTTALNDKKIRFDIATFGLCSDNPPEILSGYDRFIHSRNDAPDLYGSRELAGLTKDRRELFAKVNENRDVVPFARKWIDLKTDSMVREFLQKVETKYLD
jgi:hypothetical protein